MKKRTINKTNKEGFEAPETFTFKDGIARIKWELLFFLLNLATLAGLPLLHVTMTSRAAEDLVFKALLVNAGALHAHLMRKAFFPYIDFANEGEALNKAMVIALYVTVIFSYARGG